MEEKIWSQNKEVKKLKILHKTEPDELEFNLPVSVDESLLIERRDLDGFLFDDGRREGERRRRQTD